MNIENEWIRRYKGVALVEFLLEECTSEVKVASSEVDMMMMMIDVSQVNF